MLHLLHVISYKLPKIAETLHIPGNTICILKISICDCEIAKIIEKFYPTCYVYRIHITYILPYHVGDMMYVSYPLGNFPTSLLDNMDHVTLIAAGSG